MPSAMELARAIGEQGWRYELSEIEALMPLVEVTLEGYHLLAGHVAPAGDRARDGWRSREPTAAENPQGAWYRLIESPPHGPGPLAGLRVAIKDNIFVAGIPTSNGSELLEGFVPDFDATVVERLLDAGAVIAGKAVCESWCFSGSSFTSHTGPVHNPRRHGHSAGGSSSGCAALVAAGQVDVAVGGDQAGSVRIPASFCGVYGLKPTFGLVPYTGAIPVEPTIDHLGPISRTAARNAQLLEVIAGPDGGDPRQARVKPPRYTAALQLGAAGLRVGILAQGFGHARSEPVVNDCVRSAAARLEAAGAIVSEVSLPLHSQAAAMCRPILVDGAIRTLLHGDAFGTGRRERYPEPLLRKFRTWDMDLHAFPAGMRVSLIAGAYAFATGGASHYARAMNFGRELRHAYDRLFDGVDVLLMPTTPGRAPALPEPGAGDAQLAAATFGFTPNTFPFNVTGHPALSVPCGEVDGLPVGMMLVGRYFEESLLYRLAHAYEQLTAQHFAAIDRGDHQ